MARAKWHRTTGPIVFRTTPEGADIEVGWSWVITRKGATPRHVRVEVVGSAFQVPDLPVEARNAITTRGATAVDAFLHQDDPPKRIVVSTLGVRPRDDQPSND